MEGLLGGNDGRVRGQHEVDARVGDQVGLEFGDVDVEGPVEAERRRQRRDDLRDQAVQVGVRGTLDVKVATANIVERLVVEAEGAIGVLQERVRRQDGIVRFHDGGGDLRRRRNGERELALAAVVDGEALCRSKRGEK